jgi:hypothetical protein
MFGGSAISKELFERVVKLVPDKGKILEFGSGEGTKELLKRFEVISVEHNKRYVVHSHKTIETTIDGQGWYHAERVKIALALGPYDLIIIDGPPGEKRANIKIELFKGVNCPVIFDDVNRGVDRDAMKRFCETLNYKFEIIKGTEKDFAICREDVNHTKS